MGWEQLIDIAQRNADEREQRAGRRPIDCPQCQWPLKEGPEGQRFCPFDGWREDQH